jgi:hypothetical protein
MGPIRRGAVRDMVKAYPTLQHGGLSLLEVLVPFVVLSK